MKNENANEIQGITYNCSQTGRLIEQQRQNQSVELLILVPMWNQYRICFLNSNN